MVYVCVSRRRHGILLISWIGVTVCTVSHCTDDDCDDVCVCVWVCVFAPRVEFISDHRLNPGDLSKG